jgi:hypothetical protein
MSTSAQVETAWLNAIWTDTDITDITNRIHQYQVTTESEAEIALLYDSNNKLNFLEALTGRAHKYLQSASYIGSTIQYNYVVEVNYYHEIDTTGLAFLAVRNAFETLFSKVVSELGDNWTNTVDLWRPQEEITTIVETLVNNKKCWKGTYRFFAEKLTEL